MEDDVGDVSDVEAAVRLYIDSWHRGEAEGMRRSLHDELLKQTVVRAEGSGDTTLQEVTRAQMVEATEAGGGGDPSTPVEVTVDHVEGDIASARVGTPHYLDYLHLARTSSGWQIVHDLYRRRAEDP